MNPTPRLENHFFVCLGFVNITLIQATSTTSGKVINCGKRIGCGASLTAFISDSMTQMAKSFMGDMFRYVVPRDVVAESVETLQSLSDGCRESVVLWTGTHRAEEALVQHIMVPKQCASAIHFNVPLEERLRIIQQLASNGEKLLVQLHTHPNKAFHSLADDRLALPRHIGAISIVIPNFAEKWTGDLQQVSVNRHLGESVWEELSQETISMLFEVR